MAGDAPIDEWRETRKKPVTVEFRGPYYDTDAIETIEGDFEVDEEYIDEHGGYVIIRGVEGEVYPCGLDIFGETYEHPGVGSLQTLEQTMGADERLLCPHCYEPILGTVDAEGGGK